MGVSDITIEAKMGFTWVVLPNAVTMDSYPLIEKEIERAVARGARWARIVVDLSLTTDLYSSGIGLIIRIRKMALELKGSVCLVNVSQKIKSVLESIHLDKVFLLYATDVEFEISQEQFAKQLDGGKFGFVFVARIENGIYRINCSGSMAATHDLSGMNRFTSDEAVANYLFDFMGLDRIDSTGAEVLFKLVRDIHEHGGTSLAYGANQSVAELIKILGMDEYVTLLPDERSALDRVRK
jgi:anti-anti-sigma factor